MMGTQERGQYFLMIGDITFVFDKDEIILEGLFISLKLGILESLSCTTALFN